MKKLILIGLWATLGFHMSACGDDNQDDNTPDKTCDDLSCGDHATCDDETVACVCDTGYTDKDGICVANDAPQKDLCEAITCDDNATCNQETGACTCDEGYKDDNGTCVEDTAETNLCATVKCGQNATCDETSGACVCNDGYEDGEDGGCVEAQRTKQDFLDAIDEVEAKLCGAIETDCDGSLFDGGLTAAMCHGLVTETKDELNDMGDGEQDVACAQAILNTATCFASAADAQDGVCEELENAFEGGCEYLEEAEDEACEGLPWVKEDDDEPTEEQIQAAETYEAAKSHTCQLIEDQCGGSASTGNVGTEDEPIVITTTTSMCQDSLNGMVESILSGETNESCYTVQIALAQCVAALDTCEDVALTNWTPYGENPIPCQDEVLASYDACW